MIAALVYLVSAILTTLPGATMAPAGLIVEAQAVPPQGHATESAEQASCRKFVSEFYRWYLAQSKHGDPLDAAVRRKRANFSPELLRALREDRAAAARSPNEIVGLDFDPVLNSQDFAERYVALGVTRRDGRYLVGVFSYYSGKRSTVPAVTAELRRSGGRWIFTNFYYRSDAKTDDLLSLLRRLKGDREKSSKGR